MKKRILLLLLLIIILGFSACLQSVLVNTASPTPYSTQTPEATPSPSLSVREENEAIARDANEQYSQGEDYWDSVKSNIQTLDINSVFWVPKGKSYHSTKDCVALFNSTQIINGTLEQACEKGKTDPCSKCVGD